MTAEPRPDRGTGGAPLPEGLVTFMFTDIEGSTRLIQRLGDRYPALLDEHRRLIREAIGRNDGVEFGTEGDAVFAVFTDAAAAIAAAVDAQASTSSHEWPDDAPFRVRIGLHSGHGHVSAGDYVCLAAHEAARVAGAAHGGQVLVSGATARLTRRSLPPEVSLVDLGEHRLKDLSAAQQLLQVAHPNLPADFPHVRTLSGLPNNLPVQLTSFVGRDEALTEVTKLLGANRLLTLTGPAGTGKTRLAVHLAAEVADGLDDGAWLVDLSPVADGDLVAQAFAHALGVRQQPGEALTDTLIDELSTKEALIVVDNCEHLASACAGLIGRLVQRCRLIRLVATSQTPLGVPGEVVWRVPPLAVPEPGALTSVEAISNYASVRLFVERATRATPDFALNPDNARAVAEICATLDGIPLAIELAAARARLMSPAEIVKRLHGRFELLKADDETPRHRHATLRTAIAWSYDLLTNDEKRLLDRLSVFAGGATSPAAELVCAGDGLDEGDVVGLLSHLVDRSLLVPDFAGEEPRYRLLQSVREFAAEKLEESGRQDVIQARHLDWCVAVADATAAAARQGSAAAAYARFDSELDNVRAALRWADDHDDDDRGVLVALGATHFWLVRGMFAEGTDWLTRLGRSTRGTELQRARLLNSASILAFNGSRYELARQLAEAALAGFRAAGSRQDVAFALGNLSNAVGQIDGPEVATPMVEEALAIFEAVGDAHHAANAIDSLSARAAAVGDHQRAFELGGRAVEIYRRLQDERGLALATGRLGTAAASLGDLRGARELLEEAMGRFRTLGDRPMTAYTFVHLAGCMRQEGDSAGAREALEGALEIFEQIGDGRNEAGVLAHLAIVMEPSDPEKAGSLYRRALSVPARVRETVATCRALRGIGRLGLGRGDVRRAVVLWGAAGNQGQEVYADEAALQARAEQAATAALGPAFEEALAEGASLSEDDAVALALE